MVCEGRIIASISHSPVADVDLAAFACSGSSPTSLLLSIVVQAIDLVGICLLVLSAAAIALGQVAMARADDFDALYWLAVGLAGLAAAVQITRPGKGKA